MLGSWGYGSMQSNWFVIQFLLPLGGGGHSIISTLGSDSSGGSHLLKQESGNPNESKPYVGTYIKQGPSNLEYGFRAP